MFPTSTRRFTGPLVVRPRRRGWEFVHGAAADHSRIAFSRIPPDERAVSAAALLEAAVGYYRSLGVRIRRLLTDNGSWKL